MPLDRWYGKRLADFASPEVERFGAPPAIENVPHPESQAWALAACRGSFAGIRYRLKMDPNRKMLGLALFWDAGKHPPRDEQDALPTVVRLRKAMAYLAEGYPDDPLAI
jgi:hypothetical protein